MTFLQRSKDSDVYKVLSSYASDASNPNLEESILQALAQNLDASGDLSEPDATIKIMLEEIQQEKAEKEKKQGVAEAKKPSPKLTPVNIKKTDTVSEEINTEAYERLQKVFAFKNYES